VTRVLFIARYLQMVNHRKVQAIAAQPGIDLWHLAPRRWTDSFRTYEQELREGKGYHFIALRTFPPHGDIHRFVYWPPTLHLSSIRPDIIHIEEEPDSLAALEIVLARRLWAPSARLAIFTWQNIRRRRRGVVERIAQFVLRRVNYGIAGNRGAAQVLCRQGYAGPMAVLPQLGVDTQTFKPMNADALKAKLGLGRFAIGYVGRFAAEKGLDTLVKAVERVSDGHLLLIGRGPLQIAIESQAAAAGMKDRLTFVGSVPHHEVPLYLNAMDVLVLPSLTTPTWKEQFGHVLVEAMACGTPVIGSNSGAIPEVVESAGLIFPEGDYTTLAGILQRLASHRNELQELSKAGLERVRLLYTHTRIAEKTLQIYQAMMRDKATSQSTQ